MLTCCVDRIYELLGSEGRIFSFISDEDPLHAFKSMTDDYLQERWYRDISNIFVAQNHYIWEKAKHKAPSRRWGRLIESPHNSIQEMLGHHKEQVFDKMLELTEGWRDTERRSSISSSVDELSAMQTDDRDDKHNSNNNNNNTAGITPVPTSPYKLPPLGNFALSPRKSKANTPVR